MSAGRWRRRVPGVVTTRVTSAPSPSTPLGAAPGHEEEPEFWKRTPRKPTNTRATTSKQQEPKNRVVDNNSCASRQSPKDKPPGQASNHGSEKQRGQ